ncbi:MAG TPA: hypothetical protein VEB59_04730 [Gemmatimonadales bacterium]|nr:hypothetical protein [Gemmatimonadales bacterium]
MPRYGECSVRRATLDGVERVLGPYPLDGLRLEIGVRAQLVARGEALSVQRYRLLAPQGRIVEERVARIRFALPDLPAVRALAEVAGLDPVALFGDYDEAAWDEAGSPFMIMVLRRR